MLSLIRGLDEDVVNLRFVNQVDDDGTEILAGVLPLCPVLTHVNLRDNQVGSVGRGRFRAYRVKTLVLTPCTVNTLYLTVYSSPPV